MSIHRLLVAIDIWEIYSSKVNLAFYPNLLRVIALTNINLSSLPQQMTVDVSY